MSKRSKVGDDLALRLLKSEGGGPDRFALAIAYPADKPDVSRAADGFRDVVNARNLEKAAWRYMIKSRDVGMHHQVGTGGAAQVVESHIHRAGPWRVTAADGSTVVVNDGDWVVGVIFSEPAWEAVKSGQLRGFSPQGGARRGRPSKSYLKALRKGK